MSDTEGNGRERVVEAVGELLATMPGHEVAHFLGQLGVSNKVDITA